MKRILIFIGMKLGEILAVAGLMYGLYWNGRLLHPILGKMNKPIEEYHWLGFIADGCVGLIGYAIVALIVVGLFYFCKHNWKRAGEIANKRK